MTIFTYAMRGIAAGAAIFIALLLASLNSLIGGIVSVFPSIFLTTMVSLHISQPVGVVLGAAGPMMLGSTAVPVFALAYSLIFPLFAPHIFYPVIISYLVALVFASIPIGFFLRWLNRKNFGSGLYEDQAHHDSLLNAIEDVELEEIGTDATLIHLEQTHPDGVDEEGDDEEAHPPSQQTSSTS